MKHEREVAPERKDTAALLEDIKKEAGKVMTAFEEFKAANDVRIKAIEKKGAADPLLEEKLQRIEKDLDKGEKLSQKLVALENEVKNQKDANTELEEALAKLEAKMGRPVSPEQKKADLKQLVGDWGAALFHAHTKSAAGFSMPADLQKAFDRVNEEAKALNVTSDVAGGYLAPTEFVREIIKGLTDATPARALARVRTTTFKQLSYPKRTGQFAARRVGELQNRTETAGLAYGLDEMPLPEMIAIIDISQQMLEDSAFDMEDEIRTESIEQFGVKEGQEFCTGTGVGEMEGILVNASVSQVNSGNATTITADGLLTLKHSIKSGYARNATFLLNRTSIGSVRKMKDTTNQYLWQPGLAQGRPNTIDGDPYVEAPDMPSEAANAFPVAYGDFRRAYLIGDRLAITAMRDPYTQAASGNVRLWFRKRVGGMVILAEAIAKLKCST